MTLTFDEAAARVTAPGQIFETGELSVRGTRYRVFVNAPPTLREVFGAARQYGDKTFLVYQAERWSFARVMAEADGLGAALKDRFGVAKGDRVAIAMRNLPEWVAAFAAVISIGAVVVPLNAWWTEEELDYALGDCGAGVVVADRERVDRTRQSAVRLGIRTVAVRWGSDDLPEGVWRWEGVVRSGSTMPVVPISPDDDATILYTSGTTGHPKGAVSTHRAVVQALMAFGCAVAIEGERNPGAEPDVERSLILVVPLFHATGCIPVMLSCTMMGYKLVMMYRWDPAAALALIERERVTNFVGVPTQSWDLMESPRFSEFDTSSLRSVGGGGAPAPPALVRRVAEGFKSGRPNIGYGMTETNAYGPTNSGDDYLAHPTSVGRTVPIMEVEVRDPAGQAVPAGERGEIWLKGPNLFRGYWQMPDETAETLVDGWLRTGDIGRLDAEGFLYVEDRAKDMVLRGGENVYSAEVEAAIYEHPAVYEAAVFGVPDPRLGEEVAAIVRLKDGQTLTATDLQAFLADHLAAYKIPSRIRFVAEALPRSATGKILKRDLRTEQG